MTTVVDREPVPGVDRRHTFADFYHERTNFRLMRHRRRMLMVFVSVIVVSMASLGVRRLNLGLDFVGGVSWQVDMAEGKNASVADVRDLLEGTEFSEAKVTTTRNTQDNTTTIRVQSEELPNDPVKNLRDAIADATGTTPADVTADIAGARGTFSVAAVEAADQATIEAAVAEVVDVEATVSVTPGIEGSSVSVVIDELPDSPRDEVTSRLADYAGQDIAEVSLNTVGPTWGDEVTKKALTALALFFLVLAVYLSLRFEFKMAMSAIVAVIHDIIFTIGIYSLVGFEVTPATVTAVLTILGFSLYDTVVVFDKINENTPGVGNQLSYAEMVDRSLNQVMMRSLSTSLVAVLPVASLLIIGSFILGATALEDFALALLTGLLIGTYSSVFVAAPMLCGWKERDPQYRAIRDRRARAAASDATGPPRRVTTSKRAVTAGVSEPPGEETATPVPSDWDLSGVPGPAAVKGAIQPRARKPRRKR
jgi:preprotein translocase subunit SecF